MKKLKLVTLIIIIFLSQSNYAQHTEIINSNRPSESQSAFSVGKTVIQLESGLNYISDKHKFLDYDAKGFFVEFNLRYGFLKEELELLTELVYQNDKYNFYDNIQQQYTVKKRNGLRSSNLGFKYLLFDPYKNKVEKVNLYSWKANHKFNWSQFMPVVAIYAGANLNFSKNDFAYNKEVISVISPKAILITQNMFDGGLVFITNTFLDKIGTPSQSLGYLATVTKTVNEKLSLFIENKGVKGTYYSDAIISGGAAFLMNSNFQVDLSISKNLKDTPSLIYGGFGVAWRSDTNYKNVILKPKDAKGKDAQGTERGSKKDRKERAKRKKLLKELENQK